MTDNAFACRRASRAIRLIDREGRPLKGVGVRAELTSHEFLFGCGAFDLLPMLDENTPADEKALLQTLWTAWREIFNFGTLPFYQRKYEPQENKPDVRRMLPAAREMSRLRLTAKGHPLCWHTQSALWLMGRTPEEVLDNQLNRVTRDVSGYAGLVDMWDVINETVIMPEFVKEDNAITRLCRIKGRVPLIKALFDAARAANPRAVLLINDFNLSPRYARVIAECLDAGVPIDAIGLQTHQHQGAMSVEKLAEIVDRFSVFGLPLHFTENTFVSGHLMPPEIVDLNDYKIADWPSTAQGEERQKDDLLRMIDFLFARPQVAAFTTWCVVDGRWLGAPAGLLRKDGSRKPAFDALKKRVKRDWHTDAALQTDQTGVCVLEGFRGDYQITALGKTTPMKLLPNEDEFVISMP